MKTKNQKSVNEDKNDEQTHVGLNIAGMKLSVVGMATAVIAILAVLGLVYVSVRVIDLAGRAVDRTGMPSPPAIAAAEKH